MKIPSHILVVDDDVQLATLVRDALALEGHRVSTAENGEAALALLKRQGFQLVLTDLRLPGVDGMEILDYVKDNLPKTPVVVMTGFGSVDSAVQAMRRGAFDYLEKPLNLDGLVFTVNRALEKAALAHAYDYLRHEQPYVYSTRGIVAESQAMKRVLEQVHKVAQSDATVLMTGETGTGKNLIAGLIHFNSPRRSNQMVTVNCAALSETLLESEMFGHERGAFTGAVKARTGRFEQAHGGTLFLDEVGDMSPALQAKVLRAIEEKVVERVGGNRAIYVDVRIIAATNRDLAREVAEGGFREDLYYRLRVAAIHIPPLRERKEDIIPLAEMFMDRICRDSKRPPKPFSGAAKQALIEHSWPGNIREMRNAVERAILFSPHQEIQPEDLELHRPFPSSRAPVFPADTLNLAELERRAIEEALRRSDWVQSRAAKLLGISPRALSYKLDKLKLDHPRLTARRRRGTVTKP